MDVPINNFKGVMLCNRPNENVMIVKEKPFCSRVQPYDQWGLTKKYEEPKVVSPQTNPVLERHKKWLEEFKLQNQINKHAKEELKSKRISKQAKKDREVTKKMKEDYKQMNEIIKKELSEQVPKSKTVALTAENLKKLEEKDSKAESKTRMARIRISQIYIPIHQSGKYQKEKPRRLSWRLVYLDLLFQ